MANNIAVSITADVADLKVKRAVLSAELKAATADLNSFAKTANTSGMTAELQASMLAAADKAEHARNHIALLNREIKNLAEERVGSSLFAGLTEGLESVEGAAKSISALRSTFAEVGEAMLAAFAVERLAEWARKMGEGGEQAEHTAQILGTTIGTVQQLTANFKMMGVAPDNAVMGVERLDKAFAKARDGSKQQADAFKELGVSTAQNYTQMQLLSTVMDGFAKQADGPSKAAEAMTLLGRSGAALIPFLDLGSQGMAQLNDITAKYGVVNEDAVEKSAQLGAAFNENAVATAGLGNVMASAFAPALTVVVQGTNDLIASFIASYNAGGLVKTAMNVMVVAFKLVVDAVGFLGTMVDYTFKTIDGATRGVAGVVVAGLDAIVGALDVARDSFVMFGQVAHNALTFNWGGIEGSIKNGLTRIASDVSNTARKMGRDAAMGFSQGAKEWQSADQDAAGYEAWANKFWAGKPREQMKSTGEGGEGDTSGDATKGAKGAKGPSVVSEWAEQLHQQEVASGEYLKDQTAAELAFWQSKVALTKAGSKDWLEVQSKIYEAQKALARQDYEQHIADLNEKLEADHNNWSQEQADWVAKLDYIKRKLTDKSTDYKNAQREMERAERQHNDEMMRAATQAVEKQIELEKSKIAAQQKTRESNAEGAISVIKADAGSSLSPVAEATAAARIAQIHQQLNQQKMADAEQFYADETARLDNVIAAAAAQYQGDTTKYQGVLELKKKADQDYANSKAEIEAQSHAKTLQDILAVRQAYAQSISGMVSTSTQGFLGMAAGTQTWATTAKNLYNQALGTIEQRLSSFVTNWLVQHLLMTAAQRGQLAAQTAAHVGGEVAKTGATVVGGAARVASTAAAATTSAAITSTHNMKEITSHAATAAAAAYHAMAGIPVIGPALGAVAAATTFVAVEAFGALASFDKGTNVLPRDMIAQVHAGERIVPAADNAKLLAAVDRGTGRGGGGDMHMHNHFSPTVNAPPEMNVMEQLEGQRSDFAAFMQTMVRHGELKFG